MYEVQMKHTSKDNFFNFHHFSTFSHIFIKWYFRHMVFFVLLLNLKLIQIFLTWWSHYQYISQAQIHNICVHKAMQVDEQCHKDMVHFCLSFPFLRPCNIEPNQFEWTFWTLSSQLHLPAISFLLVKELCLLAKNQILHYTINHIDVKNGT